MANTITEQTIVDGDRVTVIKYYIDADTAAEYTDEVLYDASASASAFTNNALRSIIYQLDGFSAKLSWDATTNVDIMTLDQDLQEEVNFAEFGGIVNNAGTGRTGDILLTTTGLGVGDKGYIILHLHQRGA